jgi:hypothetical protein
MALAGSEGQNMRTLADWLNKLDAMTDYEWRRQRPVSFWQRQFEAGAPVSGWAAVYHYEMEFLVES